MKCMFTQWGRERMQNKFVLQLIQTGQFLEVAY